MKIVLGTPGLVGHHGGCRRRRPEEVHQEDDQYFFLSCETSFISIFSGKLNEKSFRYLREYLSPPGLVGHHSGRQRRRPEGVHQEVYQYFVLSCDASFIPISKREIRPSPPRWPTFPRGT